MTETSQHFDEFEVGDRQAFESVSDAFLQARSGANPMIDFPGKRPETFEQAYAIQSRSIRKWPDTVAGWKVAMLPVPLRKQLGGDRLCGPIFSASVVHAVDCSPVCIPVFDGGFAAIEAEFVLVVGKTIPPVQRDYSNQELAELVSDMHIGVEIAGGPLKTINQIGPLAVVCDFGNNAGLLVGPAIKNGISRALGTLHVTVNIDGSTVGDATAESIPGGPLQALRYLLDVCAARGITLNQGEFVSTGAVTGVHDVTPASQSSIEFKDIGTLDLTFKAIQPRG